MIAASAGNHAQGVAYHAGRHGIRAQICMPLTTPLIKVSATRGYGADVVLQGANYDEAYEEALKRSRQDGLTLVHAFDDDAIIAGQGSLGLELLEQHPEIEAIVVPIGGGGLIGGVACAVKETTPNIQVFGVQPARLPSMKVAVAEGKPVTLCAAATIADGIAVRRAGDRTLPMVEKYVDDIVTVDEEEIANAILLLLEREKTLAEGAGAAPIAALLNHKLPLTGKKVAVLVCGGNIGEHKPGQVNREGVWRRRSVINFGSIQFGYKCGVQNPQAVCLPGTVAYWQAFLFDGSRSRAKKRAKSKRDIRRLQRQARCVFARPPLEVLIVGAEPNRSVRFEPEPLASTLQAEREINV